ncbi:MAG: helix-turn-helix transcriptional regulator [Candidatus Thiodiazotropha sp. (ex Dulcina madagascariensis)]|nr:helix-turn-helix transcriptional regulator [Candidatus Thiodiazotropha sp. (ex Dulcina madagascariensis)]MCU7928029.1 helix-turn-helix transcriptional regulator [Candidatus Thiodiazotropha sp. (ex Dulcina madagascariensis)]
MQPAIDLYTAILLLGAVQGLFLTLALLNTENTQSAGHGFLALLTLVFSIDLALEFLLQSRYLMDHLWFTYLYPGIDFLFGPLAYLYVHRLTARQKKRFSNRQWLHFLPFAAGFVILIPFFLLDNAQLHTLFYLEGESDDAAIVWAEISLGLVGVITLLQMAIYLVLAIRKLIRHRYIIREEFSSLERISLAWLRNLLIALGILYLLYLFDLFFSDIDGEIYHLHNLMVVIVIYTMGYMGLRQAAIFTPYTRLTDASAQTAETPPQRAKYVRSALDSDTSALLLAELQRHMKSEQPYLDNKLTLSQLAGQIGISSNYLSQIINEQLRQNFFDFINRHRVETAMQALSDPAQLDTNILSIALNAGFNSKSAFYTAFKEHTGQTPSHYRKTRTADSEPK